MHVYHVAPLRSTSYVIKGYKFFEVSNHVSNTNKVKNLIFVGVDTSNMPIANTNIHIQINVS